MKAVILCGGQGTRIRDASEVLPKPMLPIGGKPIVWHIMKGYATQGIREFVLCLGYKGWLIKEFFLNYRPMTTDVTVTLGRHDGLEFHGRHDEEDWRVTLAETGESTQQGGRVLAIQQYVDTDDLFAVTYGDGVCDVNIGELVSFHRSHGKVATVIAVRSPGRFGEMRLDGVHVREFNEKPQVSEGFINGGFFVFDTKRIWGYLTDGPQTVLEREPRRNPAADGQLVAFQHDGFWQPMDTAREYELLNEMWGQRPRTLENMALKAPVVDPDCASLRAAYAGRRVLVTGHTGFKGGWLTVWLSSLGADTTGLALEPSTAPSFFSDVGVVDLCHHNIGDIRDADLVRSKVREVRPDIMFHLAAQPLVRRSYDEPLETLQTNVLGTANLLEAVRAERMPCAIVIVTSDKCYENREWVHGYCENDAMGGHDVYSMSKGATGLVVQGWRRSSFPPERLGDHGVALASARGGNVIGGGDWAKDRIVPDAVRAPAAGKPVPVRNPGSVRPWQHVLEPLGGYLLLGARLLGGEAPSYCEAWNLGPAPESTRPVSDVVRAMVECWGSGSWVVAPEAAAVHESGLRQTGTDTEGFARRPIVHVDVDVGEINNRVLGTHAVVADAGDFCAAVLAAAAPRQGFADWKKHLSEMRARWPDTEEKTICFASAPRCSRQRAGSGAVAAGCQGAISDALARGMRWGA